MRVVMIEAGKHPRLCDIDGSLGSMQQIVGGHLQAIYPFPEPVGLVCDDEALFKETHKWNRAVDEHTNIKGTFFICGLGYEDFTDIPDDLAQKYIERFWMPEEIINMNGDICILRHDDGTKPPADLGSL